VETPEQWPRVKEIVAEVLERDPQGRSAYLDEACAENMPLRMEVESLLVAFENRAVCLMSTRRNLQPIRKMLDPIG